MALAVAITFTIVDGKNKSSRTKIHVPVGSFAISDYVAFGQAMGQIISDLCDGRITEISISLPLDISAASIRSTAALIADVAKKAFFQATGAIAGLFARINLPTYDESHSIANTDQIDQANADVAALIAIIEGGSGGANPCDLRNNNLTDVLLARETFRKFN